MCIIIIECISKASKRNCWKKGKCIGCGRTNIEVHSNGEHYILHNSAKNFTLAYYVSAKLAKLTN